MYNISLYTYRAEKRAAWRQARLKSLEQDALQAQIMIQSLNTDGDDLMNPKRRSKDILDGVEEEVSFAPNFVVAVDNFRPKTMSRSF